MTQAVRDKLRGQKQAYKLRKKVEAGKATEEDKTRLAELERAWGSTGRKAKPRGPDLAPLAQHQAALREADHERASKVDAGDDQAHDVSTPEAGADDSSGPAVETPPPPPSFAEPEPPPRVEVMPRGSAGDWRAKYRAQAGDGREATCLELAEMYCGALTKVAAFIESCGSSPLFDADYIERRIKPQAVLVADQLLPADFAISAEMEFVATSSAILGQGAWVAWKRRQANKPKGQARPDSRPVTKLVPVPGIEERPREDTKAPPETAPFVPPARPSGDIVIGPDTVF